MYIPLQVCSARADVKYFQSISVARANTLLGLLPSSVRIRLYLQGKLENSATSVFRVTIQPHSEGENSGRRTGVAELRQLYHWILLSRQSTAVEILEGLLPQKAISLDCAELRQL